MERENSLPCSLDSAFRPYPELHESSPQYTTYFSEIHSNIILPSTPMYSEWSPPFRFSDQNYVYTSRLSCMLHNPPISYYLI